MIQIVEMTIADYEDIYALWNGTPGVGLSGADSREKIAVFLERDPGLSFVARADGKLCGAILCGQDGRRGYLHHLVVHPDYRHRQIGRTLAEKCLSGLAAQGIQRCHIFVYQDNAAAIAFWERTGWFKRGELILMSRDI